MKYAALIELRINHPFYTDGRCPDLLIEPQGETARLFERHRCFLRSSPGLLRVVTPLDSIGFPLLPFRAGTSLFFDIRLANDDFALFTDLADIHATPSPLFTNAQFDAGVTGELQLISRTREDPETHEEVPVKQAPGVLAELEIFLSPGDEIGRSPPTATFQLTFRSRQWRWAYYCITDLAADGGELSIMDNSPSGTIETLSFSDANRTKLDEHPDPFDPIATQIALRNPKMRCVRFISDQTVVCREEPRKFLELRLDDNRVTSPLPNPAMRSFMRRELLSDPSSPTPPTQYEDLLFQIIEYRAQPFSNP